MPKYCPGLMRLPAMHPIWVISGSSPVPSWVTVIENVPEVSEVGVSG